MIPPLTSKVDPRDPGNLPKVHLGQKSPWSPEHVNKGEAIDVKHGKRKLVGTKYEGHKCVRFLIHSMTTARSKNSDTYDDKIYII